jgi:hypothetical protein
MAHGIMRMFHACTQNHLKTLPPVSTTTARYKDVYERAGPLAVPACLVGVLRAAALGGQRACMRLA